MIIYRSLVPVWHRFSELDAHTVRVVFCFACFAMDAKYQVRYAVGGNAAAKATSHRTADRSWAAVCGPAAFFHQ